MDEDQKRKVIIPLEVAPIMKITLDKIFTSEHKDRGVAMAILGALWRTSLWQHQNRPYCTIHYLQKLTGFGEVRILGARKLLKELGIIKDIKIRNGSKYKYFVEICSSFIEGDFTDQVSTSRKSRTPRNEGKAGSASRFSTSRKSRTIYTNNNNNIHSGQKIRPGCKSGKSTLLGVNEEEGDFITLAKQLHQIILTKYSSVVKVNHKEWANTLRMLNTKDETPLNLIKEVMEWFVIGIKDKYTPEVRSARSFRDKFERLLSKMEDTKKEKITITKLDGRLVSELIKYGTAPKVKKDYLLECVAQSNKNYQPFRKNLPKFIASFKRPGMNSMVLQMLKDNYFDKDFIGSWFAIVGREVNHWDGWGGNLNGYLWSLDNSRVERWANTILEPHCGYALWEELVTAYKEWVGVR